MSCTFHISCTIKTGEKNVTAYICPKCSQAKYHNNRANLAKNQRIGLVGAFCQPEEGGQTEDILTIYTADFFANAWCNFLPIIPSSFSNVQLSTGSGSHIHIHSSLSSRSQVRSVFLSQKAWREWVDFNFLFNTKNTKCSTALSFKKRKEKRRQKRKIPWHCLKC